MDEAPAHAEGSAPPSWLKWSKRGTAALADQGLFAVGNFILNILLARSLSPEEYGAFSVAFATFLFFGTLHSALLTEPMLVFGSGRYASDFPRYMGLLVRLHWKLSIPFSGLLFLLAILSASLSRSPLAASLAAFAAVVPLILLTWLVRRAYYVKLRPEFAAFGGAVYLAAMVLALIVLRSFQALTAVSAVLTLGFASLASLAVLIPALRIPPGRIRYHQSESAVTKQHWDYGRWALGTYVLAWIPSNLLLLVLPLNSGLAASGAFRALLNLFVPIMHVISALGILSVPALVRIWSEKSASYVILVAGLSIAFAGLASAYGLTIAIFAKPVMTWLYGGKYLEFVPYVWLLAAVPALDGLIAVIGSALRAVERPELVFRAYLAPTIATASVGVMLAYARGVPGASFSWFLIYASIAASLLGVFAIWSSKAHDPILRP